MAFDGEPETAARNEKTQRIISNILRCGGGSLDEKVFSPEELACLTLLPLSIHRRDLVGCGDYRDYEFYMTFATTFINPEDGCKYYEVQRYVKALLGMPD
jgi:hypothetical protein